MTAKRIEAMLRPASVAVVGASDKPGSIGQILGRNLREGGFGGPVFYVNSRHATIGGEPAYLDVRSSCPPGFVKAARKEPPASVQCCRSRAGMACACSDRTASV
jgi:hypothetical protein